MLPIVVFHFFSVQNLDLTDSVLSGIKIPDYQGKMQMIRLILNKFIHVF